MNKIYILLLLGSTGLTSVLNFLAQILIARNTQPYVYGIYSVYNTMLLMAVPLVTLGIGHYLIKINSEGRNNNEKLTLNYLFLLMISSALGFLLIFLFLFFYFEEIQWFSAFILSFGVLSYAYFELIQSYFIGSQNRRLLIIWQPYFHFIRCVVLLFLIYIVGLRGDIELVTIFTIITSLIIFLSIWFLRFRIMTYNKSNFQYNISLSIFSNSIWYALVGFLYLVYTQLSVVLVDYNLNSIWAGYYNIGMTFVLMSLILPNTLYYKYFLPKLHFYMKNNKNQLRYFYFKGAIASIFLGVGISCLLFFSSKYLILLFYGENYLLADSLFKIIIWVIPLFYLNIHLGVFTLLGDFQKYKFYVLLLVSIVSVSLNIVLIKYFGAFGSAYSLFMVLLIMAIAYCYVNKRFVLS